MKTTPDSAVGLICVYLCVSVAEFCCWSWVLNPRLSAFICGWLFGLIFVGVHRRLSAA